MRILLIRHGESEGNVDPAAYVAKGDPQVGLTERGWRQAQGAGRFLGPWLQAHGTHWPHIMTSSFTRAKETTAALLDGMGAVFPGEPRLREDLRLVEQSLGYLPYAAAERGVLQRVFGRALKAMSDSVHKQSPFMSPPLFGEAPMASYMRVDSLADMLEMKQKTGEWAEEDIALVCHGATMRQFLIRWFDLPALTAFRAIQNAGNADIVAIAQDASGQWQAEKIFDGLKGEPCSENPIAGIERLGVRSLPALPDFLKPRHG